MLKKIINILFIVVISVTPVLILAADTTLEASKPESINKNVFKENTNIQLAKAELELVRSVPAIETAKPETPAPVNGWLLFSALVGFVLLCNRWTV